MTASRDHSPKAAALHAALDAATRAVTEMHRLTLYGQDDTGARYDVRHSHDLHHIRGLLEAVRAQSQAVGEDAGYLDPLPEEPESATDIDDEIPF